jgi:hypothetical protein
VGEIKDISLAEGSVDSVEANFVPQELQKAEPVGFIWPQDEHFMLNSRVADGKSVALLGIIYQES